MPARHRHLADLFQIAEVVKLHPEDLWMFVFGIRKSLQHVLARRSLLDPACTSAGGGILMRR